MPLLSDAGKAAADELTGALPAVEATVKESVQTATLNAADAVSDIVGAVDRLTQEISRWRELVAPLLTNGVTITIEPKGQKP